MSNTQLYTIRFDIPKDDGQSHADIILPIIPYGTTTNGITFNGSGKLLSFNFAGYKSTYTIPQSITFSTISNGVLVKTITIPRGIYTNEQLTELICDTLTNTTGIIKNVDVEGFLIASNTSNLLTIRFLIAQEEIITRLLGLTGAATNISGAYVDYNLPISGEFPSEYDFTSTEASIISFGFSSNPSQNPLDLQSIPLTILNEDVFELNAESPYNQYSNSLIYNKYVGNITPATIYFIRIRIENFENQTLINNINNISIIATFQDIY
jgi:hypothetical protein